MTTPTLSLLHGGGLETIRQLARKIGLFSILTARGPQAIDIMREHDKQCGGINMLAMMDSGYTVGVLGKLEINIKKLLGLDSL